MAHGLEVCQPFKHGIGKIEMSEDMSGQLRGSHSNKFRMWNGDQVMGLRMTMDASTGWWKGKRRGEVAR